MTSIAARRGALGYFQDVFVFVRLAIRQLLRTPSHARREEARRARARRWLWLCCGAAVVILVLMFAVDVVAISAMPTRGDLALWPVRIVTDFGKAAYVIRVLLVLLIASLIMLPLLNGRTRSVTAALAIRLQFILLAVVISVLVSEIAKIVVGRARPFVGGEANAFYFVPFSLNEPFASFPSGHVVVAFSLAFAVAAVWPQTRLLMWTYAAIIALSRVVLLAHHPSDLVGGALTGVIGAMFVQYWFAARHLVFTIRNGGAMVPLPGPSLNRLKRVARRTAAP